MEHSADIHRENTDSKLAYTQHTAAWLHCIRVRPVCWICSMSQYFEVRATFCSVNIGVMECITELTR